MRTSNCGWRVIGGQFVERLKRDEVWMRGDDFHEFSKTGADDMVVGDPIKISSPRTSTASCDLS